MVWTQTKRVLRTGLAAPGIRDGLRWFINSKAISPTLRDLAHRKLAKLALFQSDSIFHHTTREGSRLSFHHGGTPNYLYWLGTYEPETMAAFCALAKHAHCILDIGAADGLYAVFAAAINPSVRILAFEPGAAAARACERNIELNRPITAHVEIHALALGDEDTRQTLYVAGETGGTSSLNPEFRRVRREQSVQVRRGDTLLSALGVDRVDLIKIDTESTEPAVLRGMSRMLQLHHPDLIVEVLHGRTERALESLLRPVSYRFFWIGPEGLIEHDTLNGDRSYRYSNYLFTVRSSQELRALGLALSRG